MKNLFAAYLFILVFSTISFGNFLILPLEERIKKTNLVVVGTLESVSERETTELLLIIKEILS